METIAQYLKIMSLTLLFLSMIQGCSSYMGFHAKSAPNQRTKRPTAEP